MIVVIHSSVMKYILYKILSLFISVSLSLSFHCSFLFVFPPLLNTLTGFKFFHLFPVIHFKKYVYLFIYLYYNNNIYSSSDISGSIIITRLKNKIVISWSRGALIVIIGIESNSNHINDYTRKFANISYIITPLVF